MPTDSDAERLDRLFGSLPHIRVSRLPEDDDEPRPSRTETAESAEGARRSER